MGKYEHLFFDYDHTIWDFERNAAETLEELYISFNLQQKGVINAAAFISKYSEINHQLWQQYHRGLIHKEELRHKRFFLAFQNFNVQDESLALAISDAYTAICPHKDHLIAHAHETLGYLSKKYTLHIITNGFAEVLSIKLEKSRTLKYFQTITTSEEAGYTKPNPQIFYFALEKSNARLDNSLMIGDSIDADITGAINAGMDCVFFNANAQKNYHSCTYEIACLSELTSIL